MNMQIKTKRAVCLIMILTTAFVFSFGFETDTASAATKKPGKVNVKTIKLTKATPTTLSIKWTKSKRANKYRVAYRAYKTKKWKYVTVKSKKKIVAKKLKNLKANTKYQIKVKAYNKSRAGKWSSIKALKTKKKPAATKPSTAVMTPKASTTDGTSSSSSTSTTSTFRVKEDKNVTLSYGSTTIHLGQDWSTAVKNGLNSGSSGVESVTRKNFALFVRDTDAITKNETVYMFDIGDYSDFLAVYVANNQIVEWVTTGQNMGKNKNATLCLGDTTCPSKGVSTFRNKTGIIPEMDRQGILFGGFRAEDIWVDDEWVQEPAKEKRIGLHYINACRALYGSAPLVYNKYLDGTGMTWSGVVNGVTYTNVRFGAQAFAETMEASDYYGHSRITPTKGPLAGADYEDVAIKESSNNTVRHNSENVGSGATGEGCLCVHENSGLHTGALTSTNNKQVGIGISGPYHCEYFSRK